MAQLQVIRFENPEYFNPLSKLPEGIHQGMGLARYARQNRELDRVDQMRSEQEAAFKEYQDSLKQAPGQPEEPKEFQPISYGSMYDQMAGPEIKAESANVKATNLLNKQQDTQFKEKAAAVQLYPFEKKAEYLEKLKGIYHKYDMPEKAEQLDQSMLKELDLIHKVDPKAFAKAFNKSWLSKKYGKIDPDSVPNKLELEREKAVGAYERAILGYQARVEAASISADARKEATRMITEAREAVAELNNATKENIAEKKRELDEIVANLRSETSKYGFSLLAGSREKVAEIQAGSKEKVAEINKSGKLGAATIAGEAKKDTAKIKEGGGSGGGPKVGSTKEMIFRRIIEVGGEEFLEPGEKQVLAKIDKEDQSDMKQAAAFLKDDLDFKFAGQEEKEKMIEKTLGMIKAIRKKKTAPKPGAEPPPATKPQGTEKRKPGETIQQYIERTKNL